MNINDLGILVLASIFLVAFSIVSFIMLILEIRHSRKRDKINMAQMREVIQQIEQLINSIKQ